MPKPKPAGKITRKVGEFDADLIENGGWVYRDQINVLSSILGYLTQNGPISVPAEALVGVLGPELRTHTLYLNIARRRFYGTK